MDWFNHHLLIVAREARAMTQGELAASISLAQGTLSKYETGMLEPPADIVKQLAAMLGYPESFFFQNDRPYGFPPYHYRKRKKISAKMLGRVSAEMNIRRMHIRQMCLSFPSSTNRFIPEIDPDEYHGDHKRRLTPEDAARTVREMWMLPRGPISNMVELLEDHGAVIVPCDFGTDLLDALSQRIDGMPILIYVNVNAPSDRLRLTLAHELAHMVLHTTTLRDDDVMEDEADAFAGAFLLPTEDIRPQLRRGLDLRHLANMKLYWKVSMAAIAVRADRLRLVTPYQSKIFWMEMSRLGYRKHEPNEPPREEPKLLNQMIAFHRNKLGYSTSEMCKLLHISEKEYGETYGIHTGSPPKPKLRLVK
jgi:Zn-dependent peptidase ImmA (M78 family)/transcriptional regulator with XRE-family HTH domain